MKSLSQAVPSKQVHLQSTLLTAFVLRPAAAHSQALKLPPTTAQPFFHPGTIILPIPQ